MADTSSQKEFLTGMLSVVDALSEDKKELDTLKKEQKELSGSFTSLKNKKEQEKTNSVQKRRNDLAAGFDKQIKAAQTEVNAAKDKRQKELSRLMKEKTSDATSSVKEKVAALKESQKTYVKERKLPSYLAGRTYYSLFCPGPIGYFVLAAVFVICLFFSAAMILSRLGAGGNAAGFMLMFAIVIILFIAYVLFWANTRVKYRDEIKELNTLIGQIKAGEVEQRSIEKTIKKAGDDSSYDLAEFDTTLAEKKQKAEDASNRKAEALSQFDTETAETLKAEIEEKYAEKLSGLSAAIEENASKLSSLNMKIADEENTLTTEYVSYVGQSNLTHDKISEMIELLDSGKAQNVTEAVSMLGKK